MQKILDQISIEVVQNEEDYMELELKNTPKEVINAIRRVVKSDVKTMGFHYMFVHKNTGVKQDEQLSLEVGMLDIKVDPHLFQDLPESFPVRFMEIDARPTEMPTLAGMDDCILRFNLQVECTFDGERILHEEVTSADLRWSPFGNQQQRIKTLPILVDQDVLITTLRPGQSLALECWAVLGTAAEHNKYDGVSECTFHLRSDLTWLQRPELLDIENLAERLVKICPKRVFERHSVSRVVEIKRPKDCDICNECVDHPKLAKFIDVRPRQGAYRLVIEGKGRISVMQVLLDALNVLKQQNQCNLQHLLGGGDEDESGM